MMLGINFKELMMSCECEVMMSWENPNFRDEPVLMDDEEILLSFLIASTDLFDAINNYRDAQIPADGNPDPMKLHTKIIDCLCRLNNSLSEFEKHHNIK
jgi:hypothetical protein